MASSQRSPLPPVGIVTVSYGSGTTLARLLDSISGAFSGARPPIVVADNRPEEGHDVAALATSAGATYLPLPENPGYGTAVNRGEALLPAHVEWVLVVNPDLVLGAGSIDTLLATIGTDDRIASVGPATYSVDGSLYPSARPVPSLRSGIGHALFANVWVRNPWSSRYRATLDTSAPADVGWLSGACVLVRRSAFHQVGGFDESYFMYFEDVDLGYRFGRAGFRNVFEPRASTVHSGGHSTGGEATRRMIEAHHTSAQRFLATKYAGPFLAPVRVVLSIGLRLRSRFITRSLPR